MVLWFRVTRALARRFSPDLNVRALLLIARAHTTTAASPALGISLAKGPVRAMALATAEAPANMLRSANQQVQKMPEGVPWLSALATTWRCEPPGTPGCCCTLFTRWPGRLCALTAATGRRARTTPIFGRIAACVQGGFAPPAVLQTRCGRRRRGPRKGAALGLPCTSWTRATQLLRRSGSPRGQGC